MNLTFTDENPSDLSALLTIQTLDNVRVDPVLFNLYADEFNAFAALPGNSVSVVPEPATVILVLLVVAGFGLCGSEGNWAVTCR